ncbi:MAG: DUF1700 domain-containing protein [Clostridia bacterium]|nr:DUF1700 domain-containing protein [Clostridia bacterium]
MTYIKWKDEVESYLVGMPQDEKQKLFSYFSEMYADKRDAGISEAQIIEEFGAPYDVAKRILEGGKDGDKNEPAAKVSGGGNYNYNYYNYNYGGAPQGTPAPNTAPPPAQNAQPAQQPVQPICVPQPQPQPQATEQPQQKKQSAGHIIASLILVVVMLWATAFMIGSPLVAVVEGFISVGTSIGMLVTSSCTASLGVAIIGRGLLYVGGGLILLAPLSVLTHFLWKKLTKFIKGA